MPLTRRVLRHIILLLFGLNSANSGGAADVANDAQRPRLDVPYAVVKPMLEAKIDDAAWDKAGVIPSLSLMVGEDVSKKKPFPTEVRVLWDENFIYIRFFCQDDEVFAPYKERDASHYEGDVVEIFLDAKGDQRSQFEIQINPENAILDLVMTATAEPMIDPTKLWFDWNFTGREVWYSRDWNCAGMKTATAKIGKNGKMTSWIAEAALPAKAILRRLGKEKYEAGQEIRANFLRYERPLLPDGKREFIPMNWSPVMSGCPHVSPAAMGYLKLLPVEEKTPP